MTDTVFREQPAAPPPGERPVGRGRAPAWRRDWRGLLVLCVALAAPLAGFGAALGARAGFWPWQGGLEAVEWSFVVALVAIVTGIADIALARRGGRRPHWPLLAVALVVASAHAAYLASWWVKGQSAPAIHDISTDLADPPAFSAMPLRADNLDRVPGARDSDMAGLNPRQRWTLLHQRAYPDVRSVRIQSPPAELFARAQRLVSDRGWEVSATNAGTGHIEAIARATPFGFHDDMVLRIRAVDGGASSIVDMRAVRREGRSDLGANAERIRLFLADLGGTTTAAAR